MLDPNWTPEAGYSHANALLEILRKADERKEQADDGNDELTEA